MAPMVPESAASSPVERVAVGRVRKANPARREIVVRPEVTRAHELAHVRTLWISCTDGVERRCGVARSAERNGDYRIELTPGTPRDMVQQMRGANVLISVDMCTPRPADSYHVSELVSMTVVDDNDVELGRVCKAYSTPAHDIIEMTWPSGGVALLPMVPEVVQEVNLDRAIIRVGDIRPFLVEERDED